MSFNTIFRVLRLTYEAVLQWVNHFKNLFADEKQKEKAVLPSYFLNYSSLTSSQKFCILANPTLHIFIKL